MKSLWITLLYLVVLPFAGYGQTYSQPRTDEMREYRIDSITVTGGKTRIVKLGHSRAGMFFIPFFLQYEIAEGNRTGVELGMPIKIKHNSKILSFKMLIARNEYKKAKFRVSFYAFDGAMPGKRIVDRNITFELEDGEKDWFELDLVPYDIWLAGGQEIILSIELLDEEGGEGPNIIWLKSAFGNLYKRFSGDEVWGEMSGTVAVTMFLNAKIYL
jgi:hypothetical protein